MRSLFITLFAFSLLFFSCNSKLSRTTAEDLIKKHNTFPYRTSDEIPQHYIIPIYMNWNWDNQGVISEEWVGKLNVMKEKGLINITDEIRTIQEGTYGAGYVTWHSCTVALTPAGDKYYAGVGSKSFKFYGGNVKTLKVNLFETDFGEVTGIVEVEQPIHEATASYTLKRTNPTLFNEVFQIDMSTKEEATAHFVKYDDEWRME